MCAHTVPTSLRISATICACDQAVPYMENPCSPAKVAGHSRGLPVSVGITGFEPATSSSRTKRATNLRHIPAFRLEKRYLDTLTQAEHNQQNGRWLGLVHLGDFQQRGGRAAEDTHWGEFGGAQAIGDMHLHRSEVVEALHALAVDAAIGHQRTGAGQADLAAVGVAG